ncbi:MAG: DUF2924 domain-containing protein [Planctomycetota bacterium]
MDVCGMPTPSPVTELHGISKEQLKARWQRVFRDRPPPRIKALMLTELVWQVQVLQHGDLDAETARRLRDAMRKACDQTRSAGNRTRKDAPESLTTKPQRCSLRPRPDLPTGTRLIRHWGGVDHEVLVEDDGKHFVYRGQAYRSLTPIARAITGAHWSGPRFFNLTHPRPRK